MVSTIWKLRIRSTRKMKSFLNLTEYYLIFLFWRPKIILPRYQYHSRYGWFNIWRQPRLRRHHHPTMYCRYAHFDGIMLIYAVFWRFMKYESRTFLNLTEYSLIFLIWRPKIILPRYQYHYVLSIIIGS